MAFRSHFRLAVDHLRYDTISFHKQQFHGLQQAPLQHRKYKFVEDVLNTFRDYQVWITEEISFAILSASSSSGSSQAVASAPAIQFLDSKESIKSITIHYKLALIVAI